MQENGSFHASGSDRESVSRIGEDRQEKTQGGWAGETREGGGEFLCERDKREWGSFLCERVLQGEKGVCGFM